MTKMLVKVYNQAQDEKKRKSIIEGIEKVREVKKKKKRKLKDRLQLIWSMQMAQKVNKEIELGKT